MTQESQECAFCPATAKISGEHIWSEWMRELFNSKKFRFRKRDDSGKVVSEWSMKGLDLKANVVCETCNSGWMSNIESQHAKPAMTDLILGNCVPEISQSRSDSIALFAFKTAVVADYMNRVNTPFFPRSLRHGFAESRNIPGPVQMWLVGFDSALGGRLESYRYEFQFNPFGELRLNACTFSAGHFGFQVVSIQQESVHSFGPVPGFENLAVPFHPKVPPGISWPLQSILRAPSHFTLLAKRWSTIHNVIPSKPVIH